MWRMGMSQKSYEKLIQSITARKRNGNSDIIKNISPYRAGMRNFVHNNAFCVGDLYFDATQYTIGIMETSGK